MGAGRVALVAAAIALFSPAAAQAGPSNPNYPFQFKVPATKGYGVTVSASRGGPVHLLVVRKLPGGGATGASYSVKGKVTLGVMRANFGPLGRVAVRISAKQGRFVSDTQCEHQYTYVARRATYAGRVVFRGEHGFTSAKSSNPKPTLTKPDPVNCGLTLDGYENQSRILHAHSADWSVSFAAERARPASSTFLFALSRERLGRVKIVRFIEGVAPSTSFTFDPGGATADLQELSPGFQGSAHFQATVPGQPSGALTGTLIGEFPGGSPISLAGPGYVAALESYLLFRGRL
jgi:hypothetical protein